jgi:glutamate 5-kinase
MEKYDVDILKVGTNVGAYSIKDEHGNDIPIGLNVPVFEHIGNMQSEGRKVVIVSSIAIAAGMIDTGTRVKPSKETAMDELRALSCVGWGKILSAWDATIAGVTGGMQLTRNELKPTDQLHAIEQSLALDTIYSMLGFGGKPIVNENDAIADEEISFGDNDILAALLGVSMVRSPDRFNSVRLFLMSNTNGVYEDKDDEETRIPIIANTQEYRHLALESDSTNGTGGMKSKFDAADIVNTFGIDMYVFDPRNGAHINDAIAGKVGTYFPKH